MVAGVDIDISALAFDAAGNQLDACFFKKPEACNGAIGNMGDNTTGFGYSLDREGIFVHAHLLAPEVNYVFFVVNARGGVNTLAEAGVGFRVADGSVQGGREVVTAPLNMPTESVLAAVLCRGPAYLYPPGWQLHVTSGFPIAAGPGRDFNESIPLIEEYLRSSVPPHLLANRPPNNPMESFDLSKEANYFLDPSIRRVNFELGWQTSCDLDVHAFLFDDYYQKIDHVYRGDHSAPGIRYSGNATGRWQGHPLAADETCFVDLDQLPPNCKYVAFFVNIAQGEERTRMVRREEADGRSHMVEETYRLSRPHNFMEIPGTFVRMVNPDNGFQLTAPYVLSNDGREGVTRLMCVFTQFQPGRWTMAPLGAPSPQDPHNSSIARNIVIENTRPDLLRPVHIDMGVLRGRNLVAKDSNGKSDPFASLKFFDHTKVKTDKIKKTLNPEWNAEKMYSWTGVQASLLERVEAKLDVYDHDKFGMNDFMGRAYVHLRDVLGTRGRGPQQKWMPLGIKHDPAHGAPSNMLDGILGNSGEVTGDILVCWEVKSAPPM